MNYFIYFKTSSDLLKIAERLNISYDLLDYFIYNFIESEEALQKAVLQKMFQKEVFLQWS